MRRTTSMAFAAGMHVYPGRRGRGVGLRACRWPVAPTSTSVGGAARRATTRRRCSRLRRARRSRSAACCSRSTPTADGPSADDASSGAPTAPTSPTAGARSPTCWRARGLVVDDAALVPFAHWVTPEVEDRRFDTRFFVAALPRGPAAPSTSAARPTASRGGARRDALAGRTPAAWRCCRRRWRPSAPLAPHADRGRRRSPPCARRAVVPAAAAPVPRRRRRGRVAPRARPHARDPRRRRRSRTRARPTGSRRRRRERARAAARRRRRRGPAGAVTERATCVLAANPGPMTLDGTNTWVLARAGRLDASSCSTPAPTTPRTSTRIEAGRRRAPACGLVLLTHGHPDHTEGAAPLADARAARRWPRSTRRTASATRASSTATSVEVGGLELARRRHPRAHRPTRCRSTSSPTARCSPATPCSAAARPWSRTPTAASATTCTRCGGSRTSRRSSSRGVRAARARAGARRPRRRGGGVPRAPRGAARSRCATPSRPARSPPTTWSRRCTPTCPREVWPAAPALRAGPARVPRPRLTASLRDQDDV